MAQRGGQTPFGRRPWRSAWWSRSRCEPLSCRPRPADPMVRRMQQQCARKNERATVMPYFACEAFLAFAARAAAEELAFGMGSRDKTVQETNRGRGEHSCDTRWQPHRSPKRGKAQSARGIPFSRKSMRASQLAFPSQRRLPVCEHSASRTPSKNIQRFVHCRHAIDGRSRCSS